MRLFANVAGSNSNAPWYRKYNLPRRIYWWLTLRQIPGCYAVHWWQLAYWFTSLQKPAPDCLLRYPPSK